MSYSDLSGGAARATYRLHTALRAQQVDSRLAVVRKQSTDDTVISLGESIRGGHGPARRLLERAVTGLQRTPDSSTRSANVSPAPWREHLRGDVVNLHSIRLGTLSIADVSRLRDPVVLTLHDMWSFCGAEHYAPDSPDSRWSIGYRRDNRPVRHVGLDIDRWTWMRKRRRWHPMTVVAPSQWLADGARGSLLMSGWPIHVVPNALDVDLFRPRDRGRARRRFGIPQDASVLLFGADGGTQDPRKGFDLLLDAMGKIRSDNVLVVVFGQGGPAVMPRTALPVRWMGSVDSDELLADLYNSADAMVVPSRQEAFGQTASEAQACGIPVAAFRATGLVDVIADGDTGRLADPFSAESLARAIDWLFQDGSRLGGLGDAARRRAVRLWHPRVVADQYLDVYQTAVEAHTKARAEP